MARSHQKGTVLPEGDSFVGFYSQKLKNPETGETKWKRIRVNLGLRSKMSKYQAREALEAEINKETGGTTQAKHDSKIVTLGWFTRNRFFPLKEGGAWRESTTVNRKADIEKDILAKFGDVELKVIDKVMLQTHLNALAKKLSAGRVAHARFYLKAILEEAIEQQFLSANPARKLTLPKELRAVDKTVLTWDQLRLILLSVPLRDRILLTLDMIEAFRPSELFTLRWSAFDMDARTLTVTETAYRGKLRDYGKTKKSLRTVHLPEGLAKELWLWKQECRDSSNEAFIFPNARKRNGAKKNGFIRTDNYRARVLKKLAEKLGLAKLNFQVLRRTIATLAQKKGGVKDVQGILGHSKADTTVNVYMQEIEESVKQTQDAIYRELTASPHWGKTFATFRTISHGRGLRVSVSDRINGVGRLTQR